MRPSDLANRLRSNTALYSLYIRLRDWRQHRRAQRAGTFSQHGEDTFVRDHFGDGYEGFYVDIGCSHPFRISNTFLLYQAGWRGVAVDPVPWLAPLYRRWRPDDTFVNAGVGPEHGHLSYYELHPLSLSSFSKSYVDTVIADGRATLHSQYDVDVLTPADIFDKHVGDRTIDLLSIDAEDLDLAILGAIDLDQHAPRVICIEFNTPEDKEAIEALLTPHAYDCTTTIGCNIMAIRELPTSSAAAPA